jgi:hypothetical protein
MRNDISVISAPSVALLEHHGVDGMLASAAETDRQNSSVEDAE